MNTDLRRSAFSLSQIDGKNGRNAESKPACVFKLSALLVDVLMKEYSCVHSIIILSICYWCLSVQSMFAFLGSLLKKHINISTKSKVFQNARICSNTSPDTVYCKLIIQSVKPAAVPVIVESSRPDCTLGTSIITLELSRDFSWSMHTAVPCSASVSPLSPSGMPGGELCWRAGRSDS